MPLKGTLFRAEPSKAKKIDNMEVVTQAWIPIGFITAILMAAFDKNMRSMGLFVFMTLLGPITILVFGFIMVYTFVSDSNTPKQKSASPSRSVNPKTRPSAKTMSQTFNDIANVFSESNSKLPRRGDIVNLQRFAATYVKKDANEDQVPKQTVVRALGRAIELIENIYGDEDVGETRRLALIDSLTRLDPTAIVIQEENLQMKSEEGRKFDLTFDVEDFAANLSSWSINHKYSPEDKILMKSAGDAQMKFTCHLFHKYFTFKELLEDLKSGFYPLKELRAFTKFDTECGLPLYAGEFFDEQESEFNSIFYAEGLGFTGVYATTLSTKSTFDATLPAFTKLKWWNHPTLDYPKFDAGIKLKRALKTAKSDSEAIDEIVSGFDKDDLYVMQISVRTKPYDEIASGIDKDEIYLATHDMWDAIECGRECWPLLKSTIDFALANVDIVETDWHELLPILAPQGINSPELYERVLSKVKADSTDVETLLTLVELSDDETERLSYLEQSIEAAKHFYDLEKIAKASISEKIWGLIIEEVEENVADEEYSSVSHPLDVLLEGQKQGFLNMADVLDRVESWIKTEKVPCALSDIANSLSYSFSDDDLDEAVILKAKSLLEQYLDAYQSRVISDEDIISCYEFLKDDIENNERTSAFRTRHEAVISAHEKETESQGAWDEAINAICKCAILVAAGDGHISEEEVEELAKVKPFVSMFVRERECVEILERTGDRELSRSKRGEIFLRHEMVLFGLPSYVREVFDDVEDIELPEDYLALAQLYASKVTDNYHRKLALWAAKEVAEVDGLDEGEAVLLALFASEFGLDPKENMDFFQKIAFPAIDDDLSTGWKDDSERSSAYNELDQLAEGDSEEADAARSIMESLGLESFGDLAKFLSDDDDDELVEDSEAPPIFAALMEDNDWDDVITAINDGADVNAVMNFSGVEDLHIVSLCAQQGPAHVLKALIDAGADTNARASNPSYATNYEDPLTAALSHDQLENFDILLAAGADPKVKRDGEPGTTPLIVAATHYNWEALKTLLDMHVDPNVTDTHGRNAIKKLAKHGKPESVRFMRALLKAGCDPNRADNETYCAIHNAVIEAEIKTVQF